MLDYSVSFLFFFSIFLDWTLGYGVLSSFFLISRRQHYLSVVRLSLYYLRRALVLAKRSFACCANTVFRKETFMFSLRTLWWTNSKPGLSGS
ncbi:hypothetical protein V8C44DRAFT_31514 [Trichoderma aethiopicum]